MKFLCDEMMSGVGRWLRAAGYDTVILKESMSDDAILERAIREERLLLTRDRQFSELSKAAGVAIFLTSNSIEDCIEELNRKIEIDWLHKPFSRCLVCNSTFVKADPQILATQVPPNMRTPERVFLYCPQCKRLFWEGSHTRQMLDQLKKWQPGSGDDSSTSATT